MGCFHLLICRINQTHYAFIYYIPRENSVDVRLYIYTYAWVCLCVYIYNNMIIGNRQEPLMYGILFIFSYICRKEDVRVTLWGNTARRFPTELISQLEPPVLVVFTSLRIKMFKGKIIFSMLPFCICTDHSIPI